MKSRDDIIITPSNGIVKEEIIVKNKHNVESEKWSYCGLFKIPECQFVYLSQIILLSIIIVYSILGVVLRDDVSIWSAFLGNAVSYLIPSIKIYKHRKIWNCFGKVTSRQFSYTCQVILVYVVILSGLTSLMFAQQVIFWSSVVGGCIGYLMPSPSII